ncbi:MAG: hypothetical protein ACREXU_00265 [Gammaproteobacteria bacterium]
MAHGRIALTRGDARLFLTGPSMSGHHQIEIVCAVCHTEPYGGDAVLQSACECHGEALKAGRGGRQAHRFDTRHAAVEACLGCHDDTHSRAYRASPHGRLWEAERAGRDAPGSGVSCAACAP